jgi:ribosomal protein L11 methyltransferase
LDEQDWVRLTQSQFDPIRISDRLWIVPSWHESPQPDAVNLILDPGLAFGTGSHPTTKLCLQWLDNYFYQNKANLNHKKIKLIDYGCGSGILAIASLKLAECHQIDLEALGTDIDPQAIRASVENAKINRVENFCEFKLPNQMPNAEQIQSELVVANILANPLCALAPILVSLLKSNSYLILSGILDRQVEMVISTYQRFNLKLNIEHQDAGWSCLVGKKD